MVFSRAVLFGKIHMVDPADRRSWGQQPLQVGKPGDARDAAAAQKTPEQNHETTIGQREVCADNCRR